MAKEEPDLQKKSTTAPWTEDEMAAVHAGVAMYALFAAPGHVCSNRPVLHSAMLSLPDHPVAALYPGTHACLSPHRRCSRIQAVDSCGIKHKRLGNIAGSGKDGNI